MQIILQPLLQEISKSETTIGEIDQSLTDKYNTLEIKQGLISTGASGKVCLQS